MTIISASEPGFVNAAGWPCLLFEWRDQDLAWGYDHGNQRFLLARVGKGKRPGVVVAERFGYLTPSKIPTFHPPFRAAAITVTSHCNLNCDYCFVYPSPGKRHMPVELARMLPRALKPYLTDGPTQLYMWGGEPTQNPETLFALLDAIWEELGPRCTVMITTNGCVSPEIIAKLCAYENVVFQISFDGPREIQNRQKKLIDGNSYNLVTDSIALCNKLGKVPILRLTVTKDNVLMLPDIFGFIIDRRLSNRICIEPVHTYVGRSAGQNAGQPDCVEYVDRLFACIELAESNGVTVYSQPLKPLTYTHPYDWGFCNILPDGKAVSTVSVIDSSHRDFSYFELGRVGADYRFIPSDNMERQEKAYRRKAAEYCVSCPVFCLCAGNEQKDFFVGPTGPAAYRCDVFRRIMRVWMAAMFEKAAVVPENVSEGETRVFQLTKRKTNILTAEVSAKEFERRE